MGRVIVSAAVPHLFARSPTQPYGNPPVLLSGVGEQVTRVAGEVADGFVCHGHRALSPRGHAAGARAGAPASGAVDGGLRDRRHTVRRHRYHRRRVNDEVLGAIAVAAEPDDVAADIRRRYGDVFTRMNLYLKAPLPAETRRSVVTALAT